MSVAGRHGGQHSQVGEGNGRRQAGLSGEGQPWGFRIPLPPSSQVTFLLVSPHHRTKGARTITFAEFQQAMKELCSKRFKGKSPEEALQAVYGLIEGKEPGSVGATVSMSFLTCCTP